MFKFLINLIKYFTMHQMLFINTMLLMELLGVIINISVIKIKEIMIQSHS